MLISKHIIRFLKNLSWLISLQGLGYLFSFISIPILISKFGYEKSGIIFTVQAIILALANLSNYSLHFYVPTQSKKICNNKTEFKKLWYLTLSVRTLFSLFFIIGSTLIVAFLYAEYFTIYVYSLLLFLPKVIYPNLFYNALEKNQKILIINLLSKFLFVSILLFLSSFYIVNFVLGLTEFLVIILFLKYEKWSFGFVSLREILFFIKKTYTLFLVHLFSLIKPASVLPLIAFFFGNAMVTTYTLADKIVNVFRGISGASYASFYPILNKENLEKSIVKTKNLLVILLFSFSFCLFIYLFSPYLIYFLNNFQINNDAVKILRILSFSIPISFLIIPFFSLMLELKKWKLVAVLAFIQLLFFAFGVLFYHQSIFEIAIIVVLSELLMLFGYFLVAVKIK